MRLLIPLLVLALTACESMVPGEGGDFDLRHAGMRHGWAIFNGPKRTIVNVNDQDSINRGKALFKKHCVACHGASGKGDGNVAKVKGIKPADLTLLARKAANYYLLFQIQEGKGQNMPQWKDVLSPKQSWDLTNYIQTLSKK